MSKLPKMKGASVSTLKLDGKTVTVRQFSGVEEKAILTAKLSKGDDGLGFVNSVMDVASSCSGLDARELTLGEVEAIFLKIREVSVGPNLEFSITCQNEECKKVHKVKVPMSKLTYPKKFSEELILDVGEDDEGQKVKIVLKTPKAGDIFDVDKDDPNRELKLVYSAIDSVYIGEEILEAFDYEEFVPWFLSLTNVYARAVSFALSYPVITYEQKYKCIECAKDNEFKLRGAPDFFKR